MTNLDHFMTSTRSVNLALNWLTNSDLYRADGGVNQGYIWKENRYPFVYSEITGYAVSTLVCASRWRQEPRYLELAQQSAQFLIRLQRQVEGDHLRGAIPLGLSLPEEQIMSQYYSFDAAMCLQGMLDLYSVQPSADLLAAAQGIGDWLIVRMQQADGSFLSVFDAETGLWHHESEHFYHDFGCLHAKHAIGLLKLSQVTGDNRYRQAAVQVCNWVLKLQDEDGAIRSHADYPQVVSHPHCYATEGLLYAHYITGDKNYLDAAILAGNWLLSARSRNGSISIEYKKPWWRMGRNIAKKIIPKQVTDATAQAIRIWLLLHDLVNDTRYLNAAHSGADWLRVMQCQVTDDQNAAGGFYFWPEHPIMFTWATMFAAHALHALEQVEQGNNYDQLISELF